MSNFAHTDVDNLVFQVQANGSRRFFHYGRNISVGQALQLILNAADARRPGAKAQTSAQEQAGGGLYTGEFVYNPGQMPQLDIHLNDQNKWTPMSQR
jgi:hypothetical protein